MQTGLRGRHVLNLHVWLRNRLLHESHSGNGCGCRLLSCHPFCLKPPHLDWRLCRSSLCALITAGWGERPSYQIKVTFILSNMTVWFILSILSVLLCGLNGVLTRQINSFVFIRCCDCFSLQKATSFSNFPCMRASEDTSKGDLHHCLRCFLTTA